MDTLSIIQQPIVDELNVLNKTLLETLETNSPMMNSVVNYYLEVKGKQIRPMLVLLSARLFGEVNQRSIDAAASIELLHNASLIHDDVVDESKKRRGRKTVNGLWDNRIAVLVGDFFVSCALKRSLSTGCLEIIDALGTLGQDLAKGEIDQLSNAEQHLLNESAYFDVIRQKTASLFISCMRVGAVSTGAPQQYVEKLMTFGEKLGLCFQIKDDIFDYYADPEIGKPTGSDLRDGKITLPLIYALTHGIGEMHDKMVALMSKREFSADDVELLIAYAKDKGGIEYAEKCMMSLREEAIKSLDNFNTLPVAQSLIALLDYTIERSK